MSSTSGGVSKVLIAARGRATGATPFRAVFLVALPGRRAPIPPPRVTRARWGWGLLVRHRGVSVGLGDERRVAHGTDGAISWIGGLPHDRSPGCRCHDPHCTEPCPRASAPTTRSDSRYCSSAGRQQAYRERSTHHPDPRIPPSIDARARTLRSLRWSVHVRHARSRRSKWTLVHPP